MGERIADFEVMDGRGLRGPDLATTMTRMEKPKSERGADTLEGKGIAGPRTAYEDEAHQQCSCSSRRSSADEREGRWAAACTSDHDVSRHPEAWRRLKWGLSRGGRRKFLRRKENRNFRSIIELRDHRGHHQDHHPHKIEHSHKCSAMPSCDIPLGPTLHYHTLATKTPLSSTPTPTQLP